MDPVRHAAFSGAPAEIDRRPGGKFSLYGRHLLGEIVELETARRIVENWRAADWPNGAMSRVTFELSPTDEGRGCRLPLVQTGVPAENYESINAGWRKHYWEKMADYFQAKWARRRSRASEASAIRWVGGFLVSGSRSAGQTTAGQTVATTARGVP